MEQHEVPGPALGWRIAAAMIKAAAWGFYCVPFVAVLAIDFGYKGLVGAVAALPAIAYAIRYLFKVDDVDEGESSSARQAVSYRIGEATRGTAADQGRGR
jgi:hypothetical protein